MKLSRISFYKAFNNLIACSYLSMSNLDIMLSSSELSRL